MRILFICGCLEPGKDGVGDYTRLLAAAFSRRGVWVGILAIADASVSAPSREVQVCRGVRIEVMRVPRSEPWAARESAGLEWIREKAPDWVSLQFVPFSFHPRGLCWQLAGLLAEIKRGAQLHLMVHEPWLIWGSPLTFKLKILGAMQRLVIKRLLTRHAPDLVTTTLALFQRSLAGIGLEASSLPLFGNIPVAPCEKPRAWLADRCGEPIKEGDVIMGFFGQLSPLLSLPQLRACVEVHRKQGKRVRLFHAGGINVAGLAVWARLVEDLATASGVQCQALGRLTDEEASWYFQALDVGLTAYSEVSWGKSGVVAAMREHGRAVVACGDDALEREKRRPRNPLPAPWNVELAAGCLHEQLTRRSN